MSVTPDKHNKYDDQQLIEALNKGHGYAFDILYTRYRDWVINLSFRLCGNREVALDVMQETFTYLFTKFPGFSLTCQFKTFLYPVVRHTTIAQMKKLRRSQSPMEVTGNMVQAEPDNPTNRDELASVMATLSSDHREVILLRFVDGLDLLEIAEAVGIPVGTVKSRLHNALKQLRDDPAMKKYFDQ